MAVLRMNELCMIMDKLVMVLDNGSGEPFSQVLMSIVQLLDSQPTSLALKYGQGTTHTT